MSGINYMNFFSTNLYIIAENINVKIAAIELIIINSVDDINDASNIFAAILAVIFITGWCIKYML